MHLSYVSLIAASWVLAFAWLYKFLEAWRGLPGIPNLLRPEFDRNPEGQPRIAVIVPARNEAPHIEACLRSLLAQDYSRLCIFAVNDRSTEGTGGIMESLTKEVTERLEVIHIHELPEGWLGKPHAMAMAARKAISNFRPDYLLFTDADVIFARGVVLGSLAYAGGA